MADDRGVGLTGNATRLWAKTYGVNHPPGKAYSVELEFRVTLPSGKEIVEYVAGIGKDEDSARKSSMANFVVSTFHVIYKSYLNKDDPHQVVEPLTLDEKKRDLYRGNPYLLSNGPLEASASDAINDRLKEFCAKLHLDEEPHWIKLVYGQANGKAMTVAVTVDNKDDTELTRAVALMPWPATANFYMVKQFMIIK